MGDTLEAGRERRPTPRWLSPLVVTALAIGVGYAVVRSRDGEPSATPSATPTAPGALAPSAPDTLPAGPPWPNEPGACGSTVDMPLLSVAPLHEPTGLQVLVGGAGLRRVDLDTGQTTRLIDNAGPRTGKVTDLERSADGVHALALRCPIPGQFPIGRVLEVGRASVARVPAVGAADELISAPDRTWALKYNQEPDQSLVLQPVDGTSRVKLPAKFGPVAATSREFMGAVGVGPNGSPQLQALSRKQRPTASRNIGMGLLVAADDRFVLTSHQRESDGVRLLTRTSADGSRRYELPAGRELVSGGVIDSSGRFVAFQLARPGPDPRYELGHPGGPSDIAVLDLGSGHLTVVPGVELAPKASAGLAFSTGGRWLVIALNEGSRTRLLVWRPGLDRAHESPATLPGKVLYNVPVLVTQG